MNVPVRAARLFRKVVTHSKLFWSHPELFLRNMRQFTNPEGFRAALLDLPEIGALQLSVIASAPPTLNVLLPSIMPSGMTGGPNTVLHVGARVAHAGARVRFIACDTPIAADMAWFWAHLEQLTGIEGKPHAAEVHDACTAPLTVGADDLFLASFWTTAHQIAPLLSRFNARTFLYLIQDFEPAFYAWSSRYALALATYALPYRAIINESLLADFLAATATGRFAEPGFRDTCLTFEPAIDRAVFHPVASTVSRPRRLLVYARPTNPRNLLGLAVAALQEALLRRAFTGNWEFLTIGARGSLPELPLAEGHTLKEAAWQDYLGYAALLQLSDILLCPMLSPHTGYPVLEMAACGGISVTNVFATKTAARLGAISPNIVAVDATVESLTHGLMQAAAMVDAGYDRTAPVSMPGDWQDSLRDVVGAVVGMLNA